MSHESYTVIIIEVHPSPHCIRNTLRLFKYLLLHKVIKTPFKRTIKTLMTYTIQTNLS